MINLTALRLYSNNWSISNESLYATVLSTVVNQINETRGQIYFPFLYSLFIFILINNLIGLVRTNLTHGKNIINLGILNQKSNFSSNSVEDDKINPYYITGFVDGELFFYARYS